MTYERDVAHECTAGRRHPRIARYAPLSLVQAMKLAFGRASWR
jgi:hypothetical protein